jgi:hypothetical protein
MEVPEALTAAARFRTLRAMAENQEYKEAPISMLLLEWSGAWRRTGPRR